MTGKARLHHEITTGAVPATMGSTNESPVIRLQRLSFVIYEHPDLNTFKRFAQDFGFEEASSTADETLFAGYGRDPFVYVARAAPADAGKRFVGAGFAAESEDDFKKACALAGAEKSDTAGRHGGGLAVRITDPNGFEVQICWGQREQPLPPRGISAEAGRKGRPVINGTLDKARRGEHFLSSSCLHSHVMPLTIRYRRIHAFDARPGESAQAWSLWLQLGPVREDV